VSTLDGKIIMPRAGGNKDANLHTVPCTWNSICASNDLHAGVNIYQERLSQLITMGSSLSRLVMEQLNVKKKKPIY